MLMILLNVGLSVWVGLHLLEKVPQIHNYIWLTKEKAQRQYRHSQIFLNVLEYSILIFFTYITYDSVRLALIENSLVVIWVILLFVIILGGVVTLSIVRLYSLK